MNVVFLNRYGPDSDAPTGRLLSDLGLDLQIDGFSARCVCEKDANYQNRARGFWRHLYEDGIFYLQVVNDLRSMRTDWLIAMTDPPLLPVLAVLLGKWYGVKTVCWMQDIYPEIAVRAGVLPRWMAGPLEWAMRWALRRATHVVAVGRCMQKVLAGKGVTSEVIPNWQDGERMFYQKPQMELKLAYLGHLGVVHDPVAVREYLGTHAGAHVQHLPEEAFRPMASAATKHLVSLRHDMLGLSVPSKVYTALACGRPVVWLGPEESEANLIWQECQASKLPIRQFFERYCDRPIQTAKWKRLLTTWRQRHRC